MSRLALSCTALLLLSACARSGAATDSGRTGSDAWWDVDTTGSGGTSDDHGGDEDDDDTEDEEEDQWAELFLAAESAPGETFEGWLGVEAGGESGECFAVFVATGVTADEPCPGCTTTLTVTAGEAEELEGDCSPLPVSAEGDQLTLGWNSADVVFVLLDGAWTRFEGEHGEEEGEWFLFADLLTDGAGEDDDEDE